MPNRNLPRREWRHLVDELFELSGRHLSSDHRSFRLYELPCRHISGEHRDVGLCFMLGWYFTCHHRRDRCVQLRELYRWNVSGHHRLIKLQQLCCWDISCHHRGFGFIELLELSHWDVLGFWIFSVHPMSRGFLPGEYRFGTLQPLLGGNISRHNRCNRLDELLELRWR